MAGAGYKLFNSGDVLTAAQVNTYLQEQVVMRFADAAARTTALSGVLAEGMVSYLDSTNAVEVYNGSAWVGITGDGDITGVTAGTGISGGGTTGTVTITNDMATTITASGDIIVGTGSGTYDNLPIGTTGQVLTADTTVSPYKVKWAAAAAGGGYTSLASGSLSGANLDLTTISANYRNLVLILRDFYPSADDYLRFSLNNTTGVYGYTGPGAVSTGGTQNYILPFSTTNTDNTNSVNFLMLEITDYTNTTTAKSTYSRGFALDTTATTWRMSSQDGFSNITSAIDRITFSWNGGATFSGGTYELFGVK